MIYLILAFTITLSLFSFNQFCLFDLLGIREEVQILAVIPTILISSLIILPRISKLLREPLVAYLALMLAFISIKNIEISSSYNLIFSLIVGGIIIISPINFYEKLAKLIISVVFLFSLRGILQAIILMFNHDLTKDIALFSGTYLNSKENLFFADGAYGTPTYPEFRILGLGDGGGTEFGPLYFTRLRSFLHEPSLMVAYFALPGALSLTFGGHWKKIGIIILIFTSLSGAWSAFILVPITLLSFLILRLRSIRYALLFPFAGGLFFYLMIYYFVPAFHPIQLDDSSTYLSGIDYVVGAESDKIASNAIRLGLISYAVEAYSQNPISGVGVNLNAPLGLFVWSAVYGGTLGLLVFILFISKFFRMLSKAFQHAYSESLRQSIPYALIYAIFIEATWFNDYGFSVGFGLTMIALTYRRLYEVSNHKRSDLVTSTLCGSLAQPKP